MSHDSDDEIDALGRDNRPSATSLQDLDVSITELASANDSNSSLRVSFATADFENNKASTTVKNKLPLLSQIVDNLQTSQTSQDGVNSQLLAEMKAMNLASNAPTKEAFAETLREMSEEGTLKDIVEEVSAESMKAGKMREVLVGMMREPDVVKAVAEGLANDDGTKTAIRKEAYEVYDLKKADDKAHPEKDKGNKRARTTEVKSEAEKLTETIIHSGFYKINGVKTPHNIQDHFRVPEGRERWTDAADHGSREIGDETYYSPDWTNRDHPDSKIFLAKVKAFARAHSNISDISDLTLDRKMMAYFDTCARAVKVPKEVKKMLALETNKESRRANLAKKIKENFPQSPCFTCKEKPMLEKFFNQLNKAMLPYQLEELPNNPEISYIDEDGKEKKLSEWDILKLVSYEGHDEGKDKALLIEDNVCHSYLLRLAIFTMIEFSTSLIPGKSTASFKPSWHLCPERWDQDLTLKNLQKDFYAEPIAETTWVCRQLLSKAALEAPENASIVSSIPSWPGLDEMETPLIDVLHEPKWEWLSRRVMPHMKERPNLDTETLRDVCIISTLKPYCADAVKKAMEGEMEEATEIVEKERSKLAEDAQGRA